MYINILLNLTIPTESSNPSETNAKLDVSTLYLFWYKIKWDRYLHYVELFFKKSRQF